MSSQIVYAIQTPMNGGLDTSTMTGIMGQPSAGTVSPGTFRDEQFLQFWGLRSSFDGVTLSGIIPNQIAKRAITLQMDASVIATSTAAKAGGGVQGPIVGITITGQGNTYIRPPVPVIADATGVGFVGQCGLQVLTVSLPNIVNGGGPWTAAAAATAVGGGLAPGGVPALFSVTVVMGAITAITCTNPTTNGPYNYPPQIVITDSGNPAAAADQGPNTYGVMGVHPTVKIINAGNNFTNPTVSFTPFFKTLCPDAAGTVTQGSAVRGWMLGVLNRAMNCQLGELTPVVT
jgi:hypothetical protein